MITHADDGQVEWVRAMMAQHATPLTRYAVSLLGDPDRAHDVVQDTFLSLCGQERAHLETHVVEWLFTVCRNRALDVLRKERRMTPLSELDLETHPSPDPTPDREAERRDSHAHVLAALTGLPKNQQEVVRLKFQHGRSYDEISRVTQLTVTNVGFLIHTAIRTLRHQLRTDLCLIPERRMP